MSSFENITLVASTIDDLVQQGVRHIRQNGDRIEAQAGAAMQAYGTTYVLEDSTARVHTLRAPQSVTYLARELYAYFRGSLNVNDGLAQAAPFWKTLCDGDGNINSNYGYYTFRQKTVTGDTQLDWVRDCFANNIDTRKAFVGINAIEHKTVSPRDFPCTIGMQFHVRRGEMNCDVACRSADVVTGLPYDMGFFSLVNELIAGVVSIDLGEKITPGYTAMRATFTQIYDQTSDKAEKLLHAQADGPAQRMPAITQPLETLDDIMSIDTRTPQSAVVRWVCEKAGVNS